MKKMVEVKYTEEESKLIIQIDNLDKSIDKLKDDYNKEKRSKYPDERRLKEMNNQLGFYIRHRNELVVRLYGGSNEKNN